MTDDDLYLWKLNVRVSLLEFLRQQQLRTASLGHSDPEAWLKGWAGRAQLETAKLAFQQAARFSWTCLLQRHNYVSMPSWQRFFPKRNKGDVRCV